jgi:hypothetical protein
VTGGLTPAGRLRAALDQAGGGRVFVSRDDLRAVLEAGVAAASTDARRVALAATEADARRLAVAAWDSSSDRRGKYGLHREQAQWRQDELLRYAMETITYLLDGRVEE